MNWKHSGFSLHNSAQIAKDDDGGKENLAQYIMRFDFFLFQIRKRIVGYIQHN